MWRTLKVLEKHGIFSLNVYMPLSPSLAVQHTDVGPKLHALCTVGDKDAVRILLDESDTDVNEVDSTGETPLHKACHAGKLHIMTLLLHQVGIDISKKSNNGQTPLHIASKLGNMEAARLLLNADSDERNATSYVDSLDNQGLTPLCYLAKFSKDIKMVNFLRQRYVTVGYKLFGGFLLQEKTCMILPAILYQ